MINSICYNFTSYWPLSVLLCNHFSNLKTLALSYKKYRTIKDYEYNFKVKYGVCLKNIQSTNNKLITRTITCNNEKLFNFKS